MKPHFKPPSSWSEEKQFWYGVVIAIIGGVFSLLKSYWWRAQIKSVFGWR